MLAGWFEIRSWRWALFAAIPIALCLTTASSSPSKACAGWSPACGRIPVSDCTDPKNQHSIFWPDKSANKDAAPFSARVTSLRKIVPFERERLSSGQSIDDRMAKVSNLVRVDELYSGPKEIIEAELDDHVACGDQTELTPGRSGVIFGTAIETQGFWHINLKQRPAVGSEVDDEVPMFAAPSTPSDDYKSSMDDISLFVSSIPKGDIGRAAVLKVEILSFLSGTECTQYSWPLPPEKSSQTIPTSYALAKIIKVVRGHLDASVVMLCSNYSSQRFAIGQAGYVYGPIRHNSLGFARMSISETNSQMVARRRREGSMCMWAWCIGLPSWEF